MSRGFALSAGELARVVVAVRDGRPVFVEDVAQVTDGPEPDPAVVLTASKEQPGFEQAATVVVAKRPGTNASALSHAVLAKLDTLRGRLIPASVEATVTRDYGETAAEKSNELIEHLLIATLSPGEHVITLTATDSDGNTAVATIRLSAGHRLFLPTVSRGH